MIETTPIDRERYAKAATDAARNVKPIAGAEVDDGEAHWYLVTCELDCDAKVARYLTRRGFGIFQPYARNGLQHPQHDGVHRTTWGTRELAFPGYTFVRVWNMDKMIKRLLACKAVDGVLSYTGKPVQISDEFISVLYCLDWLEPVSSAAGKRVAVTGRRNQKRRRRKSNKIVSREQRRAAQLLIKDLANAGGLDAEGRISEMLKAVLPS